ncbi:hypothetical protein cyc_05205 [Cyclospora cayetanensis]|uniref:Secreted protein n=1 Tax=Cyclospora cayetanensis TaxID=88456 RepID=A0A1D3CSP5_9EIME|nr:hypothetical protein cyc_05205 [Cyclospora cayetanensis]
MTTKVHLLHLLQALPLSLPVLQSGTQHVAKQTEAQPAAAAGEGLLAASHTRIQGDKDQRPQRLRLSSRTPLDAS